MSWKYRTPDGEKFLKKLTAKAHIAEGSDIPYREAEKHIDEISEEHKEDEETCEVKKYRIVEHWSCERAVTVKAVDKDHAKERAEEKLLGMKPKMSHKVHEDLNELGTVEKVPRKKIETGKYFEEDEEQ